MKGKVYKAPDGWFVRYYPEDKVSPFFTFESAVKVINKQQALLFDFNNGDEIDFELKFANEMGREIDPLDLSKNKSSCKWVAEIQDLKSLPENSESDFISNKKLIESGALWSKDQFYKILKAEGIEYQTIFTIMEKLRGEIKNKFK